MLTKWWRTERHRALNWRRSAVAFFASLVAAAGCSSGDGVPKFCSTDADCGSNQVCGSRDCHLPAECLPVGCACVQTEFGYFVPGDACLHPSNCNCDHATCADPRDSCDTGLCLGVCKLGESCAVCLDGKSCGGEICESSHCVANDSWTEAYCRPLECALGPVNPPLCGTPDSLCGEECCHPQCEGRVCGKDLRCGTSCGSCGPETFCQEITGQCELVTGVSACEGDLRATPPKIEVEPTSGNIPKAIGGTIADGVYDLVTTREYASNAFVSVYERAALRFSAEATRAELIFDPDFDYFVRETDTPHRLLTVATEGSLLHFAVVCPDTVISIDRLYDREFTAQGSELWLFQPNLLEIYRARQ